MWYLLMVALLAVFAAGLLYVSFRAAGMPFVQRLAKGSRARARLGCVAVFLAVFVALCIILNIMNALVIFVHLFLFWAICDGVAFAVAKVRTHARACARAREDAGADVQVQAGEQALASDGASAGAQAQVREGAAVGTQTQAGDPAITRRDFAGAAALVLCTAYLGVGWAAEHRVRATHYALATSKFAGSVRIVQITDSHLGATFHADRFAEYMDEISALSPDIMVVTGDFVDDDTSREDMLGACAALARVQATHGVFFVYGNHDKGYYPEELRGWTNAEMRAALDEAGVHVLEDEAVPLPCGVTVVGRQDRSEDAKGSPRASAETLLASTDRSAYLLMLDHQPGDFAREAAAGADLVLCGHTHGGQFIPIRRAGELLGVNDRTYGYERRGGTDFIVSSGISNWTFRFKTGCFSEYVVVDVTGTR